MQMSLYFLENEETIRCSDIDMGYWWRTAEQTMSELEACRKHPFNLGTRIGKGHCRSLANCEPTLSSGEAFVKVSWKEALLFYQTKSVQEPSVWTNVASREKFIHYVVWPSNKRLIVHFMFASCYFQLRTHYRTALYSSRSVKEIKKRKNSINVRRCR